MFLIPPLIGITVNLKVFPRKADVILLGKTNLNFTVSGTKTISIPSGTYTVKIQKDGYLPKVIFWRISSPTNIELKLEKYYPALVKVGEVKVNGHPKSAVFTPDGSRLIVNPLSGTYPMVVNLSNFTTSDVMKPPEKWSEYRSFVEGAVNEKRKEIYVSQMNTGMIHIYSLPSLTWKTCVSAGGVWTKVIEVSPDRNHIFVSHWLSKEITRINLSNLQVDGRVKIGGTPRGLAVSPDSKTLYVAVFSDAKLVKVNAEKMKVSKEIRLSPRKGAARHIASDWEKGFLYISDLGRNRIYKFDVKTDRVVGEVKVGYCPNTIALTKSKKFLIVSCRGPNGPRGYLYKGPEFGKVYVIDTEKMKVVNWIWGKNQPTALAISPSGKILAVGDFLDDVVEIYEMNLP